MSLATLSRAPALRAAARPAAEKTATRAAADERPAAAPEMSLATLSRAPVLRAAARPAAEKTATRAAADEPPAVATEMSLATLSRGARAAEPSAARCGRADVVLPPAWRSAALPPPAAARPDSPSLWACDARFPALPEAKGWIVNRAAPAAPAGPADSVARRRVRFTPPSPAPAPPRVCPAVRRLPPAEEPEQLFNGRSDRARSETRRGQSQPRATSAGPARPVSRDEAIAAVLNCDAGDVSKVWHGVRQNVCYRWAAGVCRGGCRRAHVGAAGSHVAVATAAVHRYNESHPSSQLTALALEQSGKRNARPRAPPQPQPQPVPVDLRSLTTAAGFVHPPPPPPAQARTSILRSREHSVFHPDATPEELEYVAVLCQRLAAHKRRLAATELARDREWHAMGQALIDALRARKATAAECTAPRTRVGGTRLHYICPAAGCTVVGGSDGEMMAHDRVAHPQAAELHRERRGGALQCLPLVRNPKSPDLTGCWFIAAAHLVVAMASALVQRSSTIDALLKPALARAISAPCQETLFELADFTGFGDKVRGGSPSGFLTAVDMIAQVALCQSALIHTRPMVTTTCADGHTHERLHSGVVIRLGARPGSAASPATRRDLLEAWTETPGGPCPHVGGGDEEGGDEGGDGEDAAASVGLEGAQFAPNAAADDDDEAGAEGTQCGAPTVLNFNYPRVVVFGTPFGLQHLVELFPAPPSHNYRVLAMIVEDAPKHCTCWRRAFDHAAPTVRKWVQMDDGIITFRPAPNPRLVRAVAFVLEETVDADADGPAAAPRQPQPEPAIVNGECMDFNGLPCAAAAAPPQASGPAGFREPTHVGDPLPAASWLLVPLIREALRLPPAQELGLGAVRRALGPAFAGAVDVVRQHVGCTVTAANFRPDGYLEAEDQERALAAVFTAAVDTDVAAWREGLAAVEVAARRPAPPAPRALVRAMVVAGGVTGWLEVRVYDTPEVRALLNIAQGEADLSGFVRGTFTCPERLTGRSTVRLSLEWPRADGQTLRVTLPGLTIVELADIVAEFRPLPEAGGRPRAGVAPPAAGVGAEPLPAGSAGRRRPPSPGSSSAESPDPDEPPLAGGTPGESTSSESGSAASSSPPTSSSTSTVPSSDDDAAHASPAREEAEEPPRFARTLNAAARAALRQRYCDCGRQNGGSGRHGAGCAFVAHLNSLPMVAPQPRAALRGDRAAPRARGHRHGVGPCYRRGRARRQTLPTGAPQG